MSSAARPPAESWIDSANSDGCGYPIQNLPYGVFRVGDASPRCGVAIGDLILDLGELERAGLIDAGPGALVFGEPALNAFMERGKAVWSAVRARLIALLAEGGDPALGDDEELRGRAFVGQADATMLLPFDVAGYTDFYAGRHHATNVGTMFRGPDNALPPNCSAYPSATTVAPRPSSCRARPSGDRSARRSRRAPNCRCSARASGSI